MSSPENRPAVSVTRRLFPFLDWMKSYSLSTFRHDGLAGLTVAVVLIPQSMAFAMLAGLPPHYGLYAAAVTPIIAALWGSLRQLATGPTAIMSLLTLTAIGHHAKPGSPEFIQLAFLLSIMVGTVFLLIGAFRLGIVMSFISHSTVRGFTAAAALIIISTQLPHVLGIHVTPHENAIAGFFETIRKLPQLNPYTLIIGAAAFLMIYGIVRKWPHFPGGLVTLAAATAAVYLLDLGAFGVEVLGRIPHGLPHPHVPAVHLSVVVDLAGPAIVLALVCFAETYAVGQTISEKTKQRVDVNQEFIGQGLANVVGGFFQSPPVAGSFSRSAMSYASGARTGASHIVSSLAVILALLFLTPLLQHIPKSALSALVISAVLLLFHPRAVFVLWRKNRHDGIVAVTVFVLALLIKPDYALLIGVITSLALFLYASMHPRIVVVVKKPGEQVYLSDTGQDLPRCRQVAMIRIDNAIYFANASYTVDRLRSELEQQGPHVRYLLLDMKGVGFIDITGIDELRTLISEVRNRGMRVQLIGLHQPVFKVFETSGLLEVLGRENIFLSFQDAHDALLEDLDENFCHEHCPTDFTDPCCTLRQTTSDGP
ncbi:MAG: SulP family inorganic anion transporter [bacterium]